MRCFENDGLQETGEFIILILRWDAQESSTGRMRRLRLPRAFRQCETFRPKEVHNENDDDERTPGMGATETL
jgi:hypothetical protein